MDAGGAYYETPVVYTGDTHCSDLYNINNEFLGASFHLRLFEEQIVADCQDMSSWWVKLCNSLGMNGQLRRIDDPNPLYEKFVTKLICPVGQLGWYSTEWNFHQHGLYGNVYDPCLRLYENGVCVPQDETVDSPYRRDLWDTSEGEWVLYPPFSLLEVW